jgi:hypothetical protein
VSSLLALFIVRNYAEIDCMKRRCSLPRKHASRSAETRDDTKWCRTVRRRLSLRERTLSRGARGDVNDAAVAVAFRFPERTLSSGVQGDAYILTIAPGFVSGYKNEFDQRSS